MSSNSFIWVTEGGDLSTVDWGCLAGRCASLCLHSDEKRIRGVYTMCAIQIDDLYLLLSEQGGCQDWKHALPVADNEVTRATR